MSMLQYYIISIFSLIVCGVVFVGLIHLQTFHVLYVQIDIIYVFFDSSEKKIIILIKFNDIFPINLINKSYNQKGEQFSLM